MRQSIVTGIVFVACLLPGISLAADSTAEPPSGESAHAAQPQPDPHDRELAAALRLISGGLTPEDIKAYRAQQLQHEKAAAPTVTPAEARSEAVSVSLQPGAKAPVVTVLHGFVTAVEVLDSTGQPWPILRVRTGNKAAFDVALTVDTQPGSLAGSTSAAGTSQALTLGGATDAAGGSTGNTITITPLKPFAATNIVLMLAGESHPVTLMVQASQATKKSILRDRVTLLVGGQGPNAHPTPMADYDTLDAGQDLRNVLVGQAPTPSAHEVFGAWPGAMRVWRDGDQVWLRTHDTLINPAPTAAVSMGETRAYKTAWMPVIVLSKAGRLRDVSIVPRNPLIAADGGVHD